MNTSGLAHTNQHLPIIHSSYPPSNHNQQQQNMPGYYLPKSYLKNLPILANNTNNNQGFLITNTAKKFGSHQMSQAQHQQQQQFNLAKSYAANSEYWNKPRLITIVRATERPRKKITILLNRKALHSFEQFVCDISEAFGLPQWKNDKIRKLYTLRGRKVQGISDFFRDDDIFIGVSGKEPLKASLVLDLLREVNPEDEEYAHVLLKEWESSRSRSRATKNHNNPTNNNNHRQSVEPHNNIHSSLNNNSSKHFGGPGEIDMAPNLEHEEKTKKKSNFQNQSFL
jgi:hypothetical protein